VPGNALSFRAGTYQPAGALAWPRARGARYADLLLADDQLEVLVEELAAAIPENRSACERLLPAAAELRESRRRHLTDAQVRAIDTGFDRAVGTEWSARLPHTGTLLGCAVADQSEGSELAVESLRQWMTDATRSPPDGSQRWNRPLPRRSCRPGALQPPLRNNLEPNEQEAGGSCLIKILVVDDHEAVARPIAVCAALTPWNFAVAKQWEVAQFATGGYETHESMT
jgi:hypothetical protein